MNARRTEPTRSLIDPRKPARYVRWERTDIRRTFRRARLLAYLQSRAIPAQQTQEST
jgi:hypothetical protein